MLVYTFLPDACNFYHCGFVYCCVVLQKGLAVFHVTFQSPPFIYLAGTPLKVSFSPIISMCLEPEGSLIEAFKKCHKFILCFHETLTVYKKSWTTSWNENILTHCLFGLQGVKPFWTIFFLIKFLTLFSYFLTWMSFVMAALFYVCGCMCELLSPAYSIRIYGKTVN